MSKPMYCPIAFARMLPYFNRCDGEIEEYPYYFECTPDCAWSIKTNERYGCAIAMLGAHDTVMVTINTRPLKDERNEQ